MEGNYLLGFCYSSLTEINWFCTVDNIVWAWNYFINSMFIKYHIGILSSILFMLHTYINILMVFIIFVRMKCVRQQKQLRWPLLGVPANITKKVWLIYSYTKTSFIDVLFPEDCFPFNENKYTCSSGITNFFLQMLQGYYTTT